jgi:hypothetical protein
VCKRDLNVSKHISIRQERHGYTINHNLDTTGQYNKRVR